MSEALTVVPERSDVSLGTLQATTPDQLVQRASNAATVLAGVIQKQGLASRIQGRDFVRCEGWTTLAAMLGVTPHEVSVEENEGEFVATVELRRMADGQAIARASASCGSDDEIWGNRARYARRSMALTRATSKACRMAFSWIMVMAGYEPTPAEEMDGVEPTRHAPAHKPKASPSPFWRGKIHKHDTKTGTNKSGPWTLHVFTGHDGRKFGTFSDTIAAGIVALEGDFIEIVSEPTAKGNDNIVEFRSVTDEEAPFDGD